MTRDGLIEENLRDGSIKDISHRSRGRPENKELPKSCFFQTHRSFIINLGHITDFDHTLIHLTNQLTAYLTRRKYRTFKDAYLLYLESMR